MRWGFAGREYYRTHRGSHAATEDLGLLDMNTTAPTEDPMQPLCTSLDELATGADVLAAVDSTPAAEPIEATPAKEDAMTKTMAISGSPLRPVNLAPSPLNWCPAEDVLPMEPLEEPTRVCDLVTYQRRRTGLSRVATTTAATLEEASEDFIACVTSVLPVVLPTPVSRTRHGQQDASSVPAARCNRRKANLPLEFDLNGQPSGASSILAPRCSRRVANLPPEYDFRAQVSVAQELGVSEQEQRTGAGRDKYSKFFGNPLCRRHVAALGARIGKVLPEDTQPAVGVVVSS